MSKPATAGQSEGVLISVGLDTSAINKPFPSDRSMTVLKDMNALKDLSQLITNGQKRKADKQAPSPIDPKPAASPSVTADDLLEMTEEEQIAAYKQSPEYQLAQKGSELAASKPAASAGTVTAPAEPSVARHLATFALHPVMNAAGVIQSYAKSLFGEQDLGELITGLKASITDVNAGDMKECEAMLMGQAIALQSIFTHMSRRVLTQEYQRHTEAFFSMALKAQNQSRMTLETLNELKNPRQATFVRSGQTNIANGPQQVNNRRISRTRGKLKSSPNKLLEKTHGKRLDSRASASPKFDDPSVATVEAIDGATDTGRQGSSRAERVQGRKDAGQVAGAAPSPAAGRVRKG